MGHGRQAVLGIALLLIGSGCMSSDGRPGWGEEALWPVNGRRIVKAAQEAILDPQTWIPAAGALVFAIDDWDRKISDWASEHTPIFGSQEDALDASDDLKSVLEAELPITALATPSGDDLEEWALAKVRGLVVEYGAVAAAGYTTQYLKNEVGRRRPNAQNRRSFPSGHSSSSFAHATLSNHNLDSIDMPMGLRRACQVGNLGLACTVAWARVEGKAHYPSDVLAGAALGHFMTTFIYKAFINRPQDRPCDVAFMPMEKGASMSLVYWF